MTPLENLYYGNIDPANKYIKRGSEYSKLLNLSVRNEDKLLPTLSKEQKLIFEKYKDCINEMTSIAEKEAFIQGIKLGIKITAESFLTDSQNFNET
jgi:hypothetical protein